MEMVIVTCATKAIIEYSGFIYMVFNEQFRYSIKSAGQRARFCLTTISYLNDEILRLHIKHAIFSSVGAFSWTTFTCAFTSAADVKCSPQCFRGQK
jgi:hypothetical protein